MNLYWGQLVKETFTLDCWYNLKPIFKILLVLPTEMLDLLDYLPKFNHFIVYFFYGNGSLMHIHKQILKLHL